MSENLPTAPAIMDMWEKDSEIDALNLTSEISRNANLYTKYLDIYMRYRIKKHQIKSEAEVIERDTTSYLKGHKKGNDGHYFPIKLLGEDVKIHKKADNQYQKIMGRLEAVELTIEVLTRIMDLIKTRSFEMRTIADLRKMDNGL